MLATLFVIAEVTFIAGVIVIACLAHQIAVREGFTCISRVTFVTRSLITVGVSALSYAFLWIGLGQAPTFSLLPIIMAGVLTLGAAATYLAGYGLYKLYPHHAVKDEPHR